MHTTELETAKKLLDSIIIYPDTTNLVLPEMPEGITAVYGGTDYEQVIDENGKIRTPLVDTTVAVEYKLSTPDAEKPILHESFYTVPGQYDKTLSQNAKPSVLPELQQWFGHTGSFVISENSRIVVDAAWLTTANHFAEDYRSITGNTIEVVTASAPNPGDFFFTASPVALKKETYELEIDDVLTIRASHETGAYWATRTILQILKQNGTFIPKGLVRDYPKYQVRGFMLDVGRAPIALTFVRDWVKEMAWYKLNDLCLHLSDETFDLKYGGFRLESDIPNLTSQDLFYTKEEFRNLILESKEFGVNIVPEFDTPGHALAYVNARPELGRPNEDKPRHYLDVTNPGSIEFVKEVFSEFLDGTNPVFPKGTVINIGTDEYKGGDDAEKEAFRLYQDQLLKFIRDEKHYTPRLWGSQTENNGQTPVTAEDIEMYMWYVGYADAQEMYDKGYKLININDDDVYLVPGAGYYFDYLDKKQILHDYEPSNIYGKLKIPAGDPRILGGSYALWQDMTGDKDAGMTWLEQFDRMFDILPTFSERLWSNVCDYDNADIDRLAESTGYAPGCNPVFDVKSVDDTILSYRFSRGAETKDSSKNGYDLKPDGVNISFAEGCNGMALKLHGGESYAETPIDNARINTTLDFRAKRDAGSSDMEQILFESEFSQIKAVQKNTGKFGFTCLGRDYSFDYVMPEEEWIHITLVMESMKTTLYVNGEKVQTLEGKSSKDKDGKTVWDEKWASLIVPLARIGSKTQAFKGMIEEISFFGTPRL